MISKWLTNFNVDKRKIMHVGHYKPRNKYTLKCNTAETGVIEKELKETTYI
jgi:hypothetical protein